MRISYDIDAILVSVDFIVDLYGIIPDDSFEHLLGTEERVAYALAELHVIGGSGMTTITDNCHFGLVRRVISASQELPDTAVKKSMIHLQKILSNSGFPADKNSWIEYAYGMNEVKREALRQQIEQQIDRDFIFCDSEFSYFQDIQDRAREYIAEHINVFRKRRRHEA